MVERRWDQSCGEWLADGRDWSRVMPQQSRGRIQRIRSIDAVEEEADVVLEACSCGELAGGWLGGHALVEGKRGEACVEQQQAAGETERERAAGRAYSTRRPQAFQWRASWPTLACNRASVPVCTWPFRGKRVGGCPRTWATGPFAVEAEHKVSRRFALAKSLPNRSPRGSQIIVAFATRPARCPKSGHNRPGTASFRPPKRARRAPPAWTAASSPAFWFGALSTPTKRMPSRQTALSDPWAPAPARLHENGMRSSSFASANRSSSVLVEQSFSSPRSHVLPLFHRPSRS